MDILLIILGLFALYYGGEYLVKGSVALSLHFGLSPMIVGLTVMAFGTSAPELGVTLRSAMAGHGDIAFGNVVGSNIANILLILGVPAILASLSTDQFDSRLPWVELMISGLVFFLLIQFDPFEFWQGVILIAFFVVILMGQIFRARRCAKNVPIEVDQSDKDKPIWSIWVWIIIGLVLLPLGADFLVRGAVNIAREFGISEAIIGLTIVAIGTSLPELAASISAASEGETEMVFGNVIGSCLFNTLLIIGITGLFTSSHLDPSIISYNTPIMLLCYLAMAYFVFTNRPITRIFGFLMVGAYVAYLASLIG